MYHLTAMIKPAFWNSDASFYTYDSESDNLHGHKTTELVKQVLIGGSMTQLQQSLKTNLGVDPTIAFVGDNYISDCLESQVTSISVCEELEHEDGAKSIPDYSSKWGSFFTDEFEGKTVRH